MGNERDINRLTEFQTVQAAAPRANNDPLPGALNDAFSQDAIDVDGVLVRKVVAGDWIILKQIKSPLYEMQLGEKPEEIKSTEEEDMELLFQFTRPIQEVRKVLAKGRDYFREQALQNISDKLEPEQITKIVGAVTTQFQRYYATRLKYIQESQSEGKETVVNFPAQPAQARQG